MYTDSIPDPNEPILIMDSAADISCVGKGFHILFYGETTYLGVTFSDSAQRNLHIVTAATIITDQRTLIPTIVIINQAAYIPDMNQCEPLLHTDQARPYNVIINDLACCYFESYGNPGKQSIEVDGHVFPFDMTE